jgi:hypothetical protein
MNNLNTKSIFIGKWEYKLINNVLYVLYIRIELEILIK